MNPTAFLVLAIAIISQSSAEPDRKVVLDLIESGIELFNNLDIEPQSVSSKSLKNVVVDNSENKNFIFKIVAGVIAKQFQNPIAIQNITIGELLDVQNITLTGLDSAWLKISSPSGGYTLNNLTIKVPELILEADEYTMNKLNLGVVVLDGTGKLRISIQNFFFTAKMSMSYNLNDGFTVNYLNVLAINADSSDFELEHLGNSSEEISKLLNGIAELALPKLVRAITHDVTAVIDEAGGVCNDGIEILCGPIGAIFTYLKDGLSKP